MARLNEIEIQVLTERLAGFPLSIDEWLIANVLHPFGASSDTIEVGAV